MAEFMVGLRVRLTDDAVERFNIGNRNRGRIGTVVRNDGAGCVAIVWDDDGDVWHTGNLEPVREDKP